MKTSLLALALLTTSSTALAADFDGNFALDQWTITPMTGGTAEADTANSTLQTLEFDYNVSLGSGGVSSRSATFSMVPPSDGLVSMDFSYTYFHAWFQPKANLTFYAVDDTGARQEVEVFDGGTRGGETVNGTLEDFEVFAGQEFGFVVTGSNFDSNATVRGSVKLGGLEYEQADCAGTLGGTAYEDECGTCDDDTTNDCTQDCAGTWGGSAVVDGCGTCDDDPTNDCQEDCNGVLGGPAEWDECGTCDDDPTNDCVQDCNGVWGGTDVADVCGTCDDDPTNDCVQDCANVWGGTAYEDECGTCDDNTTNDCTQDCAGTWGGTAVEDACGTCDDDPTNDCELDCNDVWGGDAVEDECGTCDNDATNDCEQDCAGTWGGTAVEDECGTCDDDPSNDCEQDCNGDWGGTAAVDSCDVCSGGNTGIEVDDCGDTGDTGDTDTEEDGNCGCASGGNTPISGAFGLGFLLLMARRRRRA